MRFWLLIGGVCFKRRIFFFGIYLYQNFNYSKHGDEQGTSYCNSLYIPIDSFHGICFCLEGFWGQTSMIFWNEKVHFHSKNRKIKVYDASQAEIGSIFAIVFYA